MSEYVLRSNGKFKVQDAADMLGVSDVSVRNWAKDANLYSARGLTLKEIQFLAREHGRTLPEMYKDSSPIPSDAKDVMYHFKVGDRVFSFRDGAGVVESINDREKHGLVVRHEHIKRFYTVYGKQSASDLMPSLFLQGSHVDIPVVPDIAEAQQPTTQPSDALDFEVAEEPRYDCTVTSPKQFTAGQKVLVKTAVNNPWEFDIFGRMDSEGNAVCIGCIVDSEWGLLPFEGNETKLGRV